MLHKNFKVEWEATDFNTILMGDYHTSGAQEKNYIQMPDHDGVNKLLLDYQEDLCIQQNKKMNLVFFKDAVDHMNRICRILRQPRGNALLVGVGGSGRQSLTRLAAFINDYKCFQIELVRGYGANEFHEDIKQVMFTAGCQNQPIVFLFSDTQIIRESFVEDINNILNAGEVPDLMQREDNDHIMNDVRPLAKAAGKPESKEAVLGHFVQLVRENLHVVFTMSPIGDGFRNRLRMFPSLVNCMTIDWFLEWPEDALISVANNFLHDIEMQSDIVKQGIIKMCNIIHQSVVVQSGYFYDELRRKNYTTPTSYMELINLYLAMLKETKDTNFSKTSRLRGGLDKLEHTNNLVSGLKDTLIELQPTLEKAVGDTAQLLEKVATDQKEAQVAKELWPI